MTHPLPREVARIKPWRLADMELEGYLQRWMLCDFETRSNRRFLHGFVGPDDRVLHNHPWHFDTRLLTGGYTALEYDPRVSPLIRLVEHSAGDRYTFAGGQEAATVFHCIVSVEPDTYSIVETTYRTASWGFLLLPNGMPPAEGVLVPENARYVLEDDYYERFGAPRPIYRNGYRPRSGEDMPVRARPTDESRAA